MEQPNLDQRAAKILAELVTSPNPDVTYLQKPEYRPALQAWARAEAMCGLLHEWMAQQDVSQVVDAMARDGKPGWLGRKIKAALAGLHKAEEQAARRRRQLGIEKREEDGPTSDHP